LNTSAADINFPEVNQACDDEASPVEAVPRRNPPVVSKTLYLRLKLKAVSGPPRPPKPLACLSCTCNKGVASPEGREKKVRGKNKEPVHRLTADEKVRAKPVDALTPHGRKSRFMAWGL